MEARRISVSSPDGVELAVWACGAGDPLLLVHGTTADHTRWDGVRDAFAERRTVYAMDRRGRGASGDGAGPYRLDDEIGDVAAVADALGPTDVVAHSYGAICALEAARRTTAIRRLVAYEPPYGGADAPSDDWSRRARQAHDAGDHEALLTSFFREHVGVPDEQLAAMQRLPVWERRLAAAPTLLREVEAALARPFDGSGWEGVTIPVLLLLGGETHWAAEIVAEIERALPGATTSVMPGQQHVAMDTGRELFLDAVLGFLDAPA